MDSTKQKQLTHETSTLLSWRLPLQLHPLGTSFPSGSEPVMAPIFPIRRLVQFPTTWALDANRWGTSDPSSSHSSLVCKMGLIPVLEESYWD